PGRTPTRRWGTARIAGHLGMHPSTVHRILTRHRMPRLAHTDRATERTVRRYERVKPGELVHVDIKKLSNIPDGGGHKALGRTRGRKNRSKAGYAYLHNAVDDHSRLAYCEILTDEKKDTATGFWKRAQVYFASVGITVERVLTDNGSCYKSHSWRDLLAGQGIKHKRTRPYRPQTNGKVERFNRTLVQEWAYARPYRSEAEKREAFTGRLHHDNHHRFPTALGGPPASRVPNLSGQYT
ncbi:IS481 family transposase, partial [Nocardiopsis sp. MG754419]|uniref:IS481 family transposase n=1 Tax=Nocardiopsis sp. MG754419 TaxID=2259865 RepID=UPI001BA7F9B3